MRKFLLTTAICIAGTLSTNAIAAPKAFTLDASHTNILLRVSHLGFSEMVVEALNPEGTINFDKESPENSSVEIIIKSENIDGDGEKFNAHLHSADFFDVENHPEITFKSTNIEVTGENTANITGDLTLLGITKPVTLDTAFNKGGEHPMSKKQVIGFTAKGSLKRSDFGMEYGLPGVGDEITLDINVEAVE